MKQRKKIFPPHLPARPFVRHRNMRNQIRSLYVVLILVFSGVTAAAISLSIIAWVVPNGYSYPASSDIVIRTQQIQTSNQPSFEPLLAQKVEKREIRLYNAKQKTTDGFYAGSAYIADAVLLSAGGWAVFYPTQAVPQKRFIEAVDYQGQVYTITNLFHDKVSGFTFIQIDGDNFRGDLSFAGAQAFSGKTSLVARAKGINSAIAIDSFIQKDTHNTLPIWQPQYIHTFIGQAKPGNMVFTLGSGELVGFIGKNNTIVPAWMVQSQLNGLFEDGNTAYTILDIGGYEIDGFVDEDEVFQTKTGWYITTSATKATTSTLGIGDVIVEINKKPFSTIDAAQHILLGPNPLPLRIIRNTEYTDILVNKTTKIVQ